MPTGEARKRSTKAVGKKQSSSVPQNGSNGKKKLTAAEKKRLRDLAKGNEIRLERSAVLRKLRHREMTLAEVLDHKIVQGAKLSTVLRNAPMRFTVIPKSRAVDHLPYRMKVVCRDLNIWDVDRRVRSLTQRQKNVLASFHAGIVERGRKNYEAKQG